MGKKCFPPSCNSGYKSCTEKLPPFTVPKEEERLHIWQHAIPRKNRVLQAACYIFEKHFETLLVAKAWEPEYNGQVLLSALRKASLAKDALTTKFPECSSYMLKTKKKQKGCASRQCPFVTRRHRVTEERSASSYSPHKDES